MLTIYCSLRDRFVGWKKLLHICEKELHWLDMAINFKKSCCLRIGPHYDTHCMNLWSMTGSMLLWVDNIRYHGVHCVRAKYFKCSLDYAKRSFHRAANSIFGKIGRIASEEFVLQLIKGKCLPIFTARRYASAVLGVVLLSVCPSVRPSVCLSHACFVTNPKNLPALFLYHIKGQSFQFSTTQ